MRSFARNPPKSDGSFKQPINPDDEAGDQVIFTATPDTILINGEELTGTFEGEWLGAGRQRPDDISDNVTYEWSADFWYETLGNESIIGQQWKDYNSAILDMEGDYTGFANNTHLLSGTPLPLIFYGASNLIGGVPFSSAFNSAYDPNNNHMQALCFGPVDISFITNTTVETAADICGVFKSLGIVSAVGMFVTAAGDLATINSNNGAGPWVSGIRPFTPEPLATAGMFIHSNNCVPQPPELGTGPISEVSVSNRLFVRRKRKIQPSSLEREGGIIHPHDPNFFIDPNGILKINHKPVEISGTFKQLQLVEYNSGLGNPQPFNAIDPRTKNGIDPTLELGDSNYDNEEFWTDAANEAGLDGTYNPSGDPVQQNVFPKRITMAARSIIPVKPSKLTWFTIGATSVTIDQGIGAVATTGFIDVAPAQTTEYTLTAVGDFGVSTRKVIVHVAI